MPAWVMRAAGGRRGARVGCAGPRMRWLARDVREVVCGAVSRLP